MEDSWLGNSGTQKLQALSTIYSFDQLEDIDNPSTNQAYHQTSFNSWL